VGSLQYSVRLNQLPMHPMQKLLFLGVKALRVKPVPPLTLEEICVLTFEIVTAVLTVPMI